MPLKIRHDVEKSGLVSCKRKHDVYQCSGNTTLCIDSCGWLPVLLVHLYVVFHVWYARMYESGAGAVLVSSQASVAGAADGGLFGVAVEYYSVKSFCNNKL